MVDQPPGNWTAWGHYSQIVWGSTARVGCGFAPPGKLAFGLVVCRYGPPGNFSGQSATDIATTIAESMSGFTTEAVESGLATVDEFVCINETPTSALSRLATDVIPLLPSAGGQSAISVTSTGLTSHQIGLDIARASAIT